MMRASASSALAVALVSLVLAAGAVSLAFAGAPVSSALDILRDSREGFTRADSPRTFAFPRDHGPHPDFRHDVGEWNAVGEQFVGIELHLVLADKAADASYR